MSDSNPTRAKSADLVLCAGDLEIFSGNREAEVLVWDGHGRYIALHIHENGLREITRCFNAILSPTAVGARFGDGTEATESSRGDQSDLRQDIRDFLDSKTGQDLESLQSELKTWLTDKLGGILAREGILLVPVDDATDSKGE